MQQEFCNESVILQKPTREDWRGGLDAITFSLEYQKALNNSLLDVHRIASTNSDPHVSEINRLKK